MKDQPLRTALISVADKTGVVEFGRALATLNVLILSTGGTAQLLKQHQIPLTELSSYTHFPELFDGRVKTFHPKVYAGILARREITDDLTALAALEALPIDLICVNLYPFETITQAKMADLSTAIEAIDIGGPALMRAGAKNYASVAVVSEPQQYEAVIAELKSCNGALSESTRLRLAQHAFALTARYDEAIAQWMTVDKTAVDAPFPKQLALQFKKMADLRYGENPHQSAAFYKAASVPTESFVDFQQHQGKALSYNNLADADAAWALVQLLNTPACTIVKHLSPCGASSGTSSLDAFCYARNADPTSAFGGIIAFNDTVDEDTAASLIEYFCEVVIAPYYTAEALAVLAHKPKIRVLENTLQIQHTSSLSASALDYRWVNGGLLVQTVDNELLRQAQLSVATRLKPNVKDWADLLFAWKVAQCAKSNAVVFVNDLRTLAIGSGQTSRVDAIHSACLKAQRSGHSLNGTVVASDAFFPFKDAIDLIADTGARVIIQPGGSSRDEEVVAAADAQGLAMVMTGIRHFKH